MLILGRYAIRAETLIVSSSTVRLAWLIYWPITDLVAADLGPGTAPARYDVMLTHAIRRSMASCPTTPPRQLGLHTTSFLLTGELVPNRRQNVELMQCKQKEPWTRVAV